MTDFCSRPAEEQAAYYAQAMAWVNDGDGYCRVSHIRVTHIAPGYAEGELEITPEVYNPRGMVHGGCLATLADTITGVAAHSTGMGCVTLNCTMNYLRPAVKGKVHCRASVQKSGRTIQVCDTELLDDNGALVATGTFTYYTVEPDARSGRTK